MQSRNLIALAGAVALGVAVLGASARPQGGQQVPGQPGTTRGQRPTRDTAQAGSTPGTGVISGRVFAADTGRPIKRARVMASDGGRGSRSAITDDQGRYQIAELHAGSYTVTASRTGYVDGTYGQRRPLQPGTPLTLEEAQAAPNVDLRLIHGGVITGRVGDEDGEPLARAIVTVQRYQYVRGERQLSPAGAGQTDDRGQYRVFGLPPGDYYVSASTSGLADLLGRGVQQLAAGMGDGRGGRGFGPFGAPDQPQEQTGYAPTYYPGVVNATEAGKVTLGAGQEVVGIDFQVQLVPLATVSGLVAGATDPAMVMLVPQDTRGGGGPLGGQIYNGRAGADGAFTVTNVPPGRYTAVARTGGRGADPRTAMQAVVVNGQSVDGVTLVLQPGVTLSGNITVESSGTPSPTDYSVFRVDVVDTDPLPGGGRGGGRGGSSGADNRVEKNGAFAIANIQPGRHSIRVAGSGQDGARWTLKSVLIGATEVADAPFELKPGQNADGVTIVLGDRTTDLAGTVRDGRNAGAPGMTVIAFSIDPQYWRAQSRRIATSPSGGTGAYRITGLPAGAYYVVAVDDVEQGEWFDPAYLDSVKDKATRVSLNDGETRTQDLRGTAPRSD